MVRGYVPQKITYVDDKPDIILATHQDIFNLQRADDRPAYGVAIESAAIMPGLYENLLANTPILRQRYKAIFTWHPACLQHDAQFYRQIPAYCGWINTEYGGGLGKDLINGADREPLSTITSDKQMCGGHQLRHIISSQLKNMNGFTGYGNFFKNPVANSWLGTANFRFQIVIENDCIDNYFTEKVLNCFQTRTIPIYWGCPNLAQFGFDTNGVVPLERFVEFMKKGGKLTDFCSVEEYNALRDAINSNYDLTASTYSRALEDIIYEKLG